jgi:hypothetical protein
MELTGVEAPSRGLNLKKVDCGSIAINSMVSAWVFEDGGFCMFLKVLSPQFVEGRNAICKDGKGTWVDRYGLEKLQS